MLRENILATYVSSVSTFNKQLTHAYHVAVTSQCGDVLGVWNKGSRARDTF